MTEKQLEQVKRISKELSQLNRLMSLLEQAYNDDFNLSYYNEDIKAYVNIWLYLTSEEKKRHHPANQTIHQGPPRPKATGICGALIKTKRI